jgi:hypothetical protein
MPTNQDEIEIQRVSIVYIFPISRLVKPIDFKIPMSFRDSQTEERMVLKIVAIEDINIRFADTSNHQARASVSFADNLTL